MRVLVIGGGGREHALCWKLSQSSSLSKLWCAPGNPGIAEVAECVPIPQHDKRRLVNFAVENRVDLVIPGPEGPLVDGIADDLAVFSIPCCGPSKAAARLEGSKSFTKEICRKAGIPTASWATFDHIDAAHAHIDTESMPIVIKADGLAGGKGVVVTHDRETAKEAATSALTEHGRVVIEECLVGPEISFFVLCNDADDIALVGSARDHKRLLAYDNGPNTGGMGAVSPSPDMSDALRKDILDKIIRPTLAAMREQGTPFRGILFAGLMLTLDGPKLIEYNVRFGDPECQALMPLIDVDLLQYLYVTATGGSYSLLERPAIARTGRASCAVVMASPGYPEAPQKGSEIKAIPTGPLVFHSGTILDNGRLLANGGRVLTVTGVGDDLQRARQAAYSGISKIDWPEGHYRSDIGC